MFSCYFPIVFSIRHATTLTKSNLNGNNLKMVAQGDNSYHVTATGVEPYFAWSVEASKSYAVTVFPVFSMALRNFRGAYGHIHYCAGGILTAHDDYKLGWTIYDEGCLMFGEDREYSLIVIDLAAIGAINEKLKEKDGRIHVVSPDFSLDDITDPEVAEWDILYMGWFRSVEETQQYTIDRLGMNPSTEPDTTDAPDTNAPGTNAPETNASVDTNGGEGAATTAGTEEPTSGCTSAVGFGAATVLAAAATFVALKRKD